MVTTRARATSLASASDLSPSARYRSRRMVRRAPERLGARGQPRLGRGSVPVRRRLAASALALASALVMASPAQAATVTGTVTASRVPPGVPAAITHDRHACGQRGMVWSSTVAADGLARVEGAIVYIAARAPSDARALSIGPPQPPPPLVIDQQDCAFVPAVAAMSVGAELRVRSSDPVFHNAHVRRADGSTAANVSTPLAGTEATALVATSAGPLVLTCDAGHHWMRADILVLEHRLFTRTERGGRFRLDGVPPGAWWLVAWHPRVGERRVPIDVVAPDQRLSRPLAL